MKHIYIILSVMIILSCNKQESFMESKVWYTFSHGNDNQDFFDFEYQEFFFSNKNKVYISNMLSHSIDEKSFEIKDDSLFIKNVNNIKINNFLMIPFSKNNNSSVKLVFKKDTLVLKEVRHSDNELSLRRIIKKINKRTSNKDFDSLVNEYREGFLRRSHSIFNSKNLVQGKD